ncbi:MAG: hypothetical protein WC222_08705 [Parachlamydiales bacterium]|jgi:hypothetical protein
MNIPGAEKVLSWEFWFTMALCVHLIAGTVALLSFWVPLVTAKGSKLHIHSGMTFIASVGVTVACGVIMTVMHHFDPLNPPASIAKTAFFLYLCLFTLGAAWHGLRVYLLKPPAPQQVIMEKFNAAFIIFFGLLTALTGLKEGNMLYTLFPFIGIGLGIKQYLFWNTWPPEKFTDLMIEHMRSMISCVIASLTAFCVIAVPRIFGANPESLILWFGPTVALVPLIIYWQIRLKNA